MSWNFRVVADRNGQLAIHEVYYNEKGKATSMVVSPALIHGFEDKESLRFYVKKMQDALEKPVLDGTSYETLGYYRELL